MLLNLKDILKFEGFYDLFKLYRENFGSPVFLKQACRGRRNPRKRSQILFERSQILFEGLMTGSE